MTVVAVLNVEEIPLVFSDVMMTTKSAGVSKAIPTLGDINYFKLQFRVVGLQRKMYSPSRSCQMSIAGTLSNAKEFVSLLGRMVGPSVVTTEIFAEAVKAFPANKLETIGIVGYGYDSLNGEGNWFSHNASEVIVPYFGRCLVAGSGTKSFISWLHAAAPAFSKQPSLGDPFHDAKAKAHTLLGKLVHEDSLLHGDSRFPAPLIQRYGGWYEISHFEKDGTFRTLSNVALFDLAPSRSRDTHLLKRLYIFSETNETLVVVAYVASEILPIVIEDRTCFRLPLSEFPIYRMTREADSCSIPTVDEARELCSSVESAIMHLHNDVYLCANGTVIERGGDEKYLQTSGTPATDIQRFIELDLYTEDPRIISVRVDQDYVVLAIDTSWLNRKILAMQHSGSKAEIVLG